MATKSNSNSGSKRANSDRKKRATKQSAISRRSVGGVLSGHRSDLWGLGAILVGLLTAASLWFGATGVVGVFVDDALAAGVGLIRFVVPLGLVALGVALIRGPGDDGESEWPARLAVGGILLLISLSGLLHVVRGRPGIQDTVDDLGAAGGVLGLAIGGALHATTAVTGSLLILGLLGIAGLIVLTGSSAGALGRGLLIIVRPPLNWLKVQIQALSAMCPNPKQPKRLFKSLMAPTTAPLSMARFFLRAVLVTTMPPMASTTGERSKKARRPR